MSDSSTYTVDNLMELTTNRNIVALTATSAMSPIDGDGAPISPPTYAEARDKNVFAGGMAITDNVAQRVINREAGVAEVKIDPETGRPMFGPSVIVDSVGSQTTRAENALWELRDELELPGICYIAPEVERVDNAIDKAVDKVKVSPGDKEMMAKSIRHIVASEVPTLSSWTTPHRHVDGLIRLSNQNGEAMWSSDNDLYRTLSQAGPGNIKELLRLSPNSVLFGFWASIGMPIRHKLARAFSQDVIGYGATKLYSPATKGAPLEASREVLSNADGEIAISAKGASTKKMLAPSQLGLGSIPSGRANSVVCSSIVGTGAVSLTHLRNTIGRERDGWSTEDKDMAVAALTALAIAGRALVLNDGFYRSECALVDTSTQWTTMTRGQGSALRPDVPHDVDGALDLAKQVFTKAREQGVWGGVEDRQYVELSPRLLDLTVTSYATQMKSAIDSLVEGEGA